MTQDQPDQPPQIDTSVASIARIYDYWLGGKDNFKADREAAELMIRESLQRWVGSAVTGSVTLRLRRGEDYSILDTAGPAFSYHPDKLSMERTEDSAFGPLDRIGQLTMRNLDIADSRAKLEQYAGLGLIGAGGHPAIGAAQAAATGLIGTMPEMPEGGAEAIASRGEISGDEELLDRAAMEFGTD